MADNNIPALIDTAEALTAKLDAMRQAQRTFAAYTQEQVDRIFFEAAKAAGFQGIFIQKQPKIRKMDVYNLVNPLHIRLFGIKIFIIKKLVPASYHQFKNGVKQPEIKRFKSFFIKF